MRLLNLEFGRFWPGSSNGVGSSTLYDNCESCVATACRDVSAALAELTSQTSSDRQFQDLDCVEVARLRVDVSLAEARTAPCGDSADICSKIRLHRELCNWAGEEDSRVRLFERHLLWEMSELFLQGQALLSPGSSPSSSSM